MAERVELFQATIPAGTAVATPATFALAMSQCVVRRLEVIVPPGPSGLVGFKVLHSGQVVIPYRGTGWIITDNERIGWDLEGYPVGDKWSIQAYNTGLFTHTLHIRLLADELPSALPGLMVPIQIG